MNNNENALKIVDYIAKCGRFFHFKMGSGRYRLLTVILEHGGSISQKELQDELEIKSGSVSEIIGKFAQDELVEKRRSAKDGRQMTLCLTGEGAAQAVSVRESYERRAENIFEGFSEEDKQELLRLLERLYENIGRERA